MACHPRARRARRSTGTPLTLRLLPRGTHLAIIPPTMETAPWATHHTGAHTDGPMLCTLLLPGDLPNYMPGSVELDTAPGLRLLVSCIEIAVEAIREPSMHPPRRRTGPGMDTEHSTFSLREGSFWRLRFRTVPEGAGAWSVARRHITSWSLLGVGRPRPSRCRCLNTSPRPS